MSFAPLQLAHAKRGNLCIFKIANSKFIFLFIASGLATLTGCMGGSAAGFFLPATSNISVTISPDKATLKSGASLQFTATVTGADQSAVRWSATAGKISASGMLQAPEVTSDSNVTVVATSEVDNQSQASAVVNVTAPGASPGISTTALPNGTVGRAYTATLSATGGQPPYQWSDVSGALPSGIRLNAASGELSGTPTVADTFSFVIGVTDAGANRAQQSLRLAVDSAVLAGSGVSPCAAPTYGCVRTDSSATSLAPLPAWGGLNGAGTVFTDPSFNPSSPPKYVRVTDYASGPNHWFSVGTGNGDDAHFNLDDTLLWVTNDGAAIFVFGFVPRTMQVGLASSLNPGLYWGGAHFSQVNRDYLYTMTPSTGKLWRLDFTGISITEPNNNPPATLIYDFSNCGVSGWAVFAGIGGRDNVFSAYFGSQDDPSAIYVAAYVASAQQCYLYNTHSGTILQYPGGNQVGQVSMEDRFFIHGAHLPDPTGKWMWVTRSACSSGSSPMYAWQVGTTTVIPCGPYCDGHVAANAKGFFNSASFSPTNQYPSLLYRSWQAFAGVQFTELNTRGGTYDITLDVHPTTKNDPQGDQNYPIFASTTAPQTTAPYENEIIAWQQPSGPVLRFGHTFSSGQSANFQAQIAVGAVSSTGQYYAFTTDGEGTLGNTDGVHSTCTLSEGTCRNDVFILNLAPPPGN